MALYNIPIYQGYGQTETALRVTGVPLDLDRETYGNLIDANSIGKPMEWAEVEILSKKGKILGEKEEGELAVKGRAVMKGYLNNSEAFLNGYFLTGDIGYYKVINNERYFFLKGRKKEIIIKGGINISPAAIENKLKETFADIGQVFVIGVPDRRFGEEIAAIICWKGVSIKKAKAYLKYKLAKGIKAINRYEIPKYITTIDAQDLPITSTGKVQRSLIKNKISMEVLEPVNLVAKTNKHKFILLAKDSLKIKEAFALYNYSWDPLIISFDKFGELISNTTTIMAIDKDAKIKGLITFMRLDETKNKLSNSTYSKLVHLQEKNITDNNGDSLVCISICGPNYREEPIPSVKKVPTVEEVKEYLSMGKDGVYNFHAKPKGGFDKGASL
ncbi:MAG: fatty acid--CoA ligase family protein, partial [Patescibacteria group bacterium]